jgi:ankyrin repeat protein
MNAASDILQGNILDAILEHDPDRLADLLGHGGCPADTRITTSAWTFGDILADTPPAAFIAIFFRSIGCFRLFMNLSFPLATRDAAGRSAAHFACASGSMEICRELDLYAPAASDFFATPDRRGDLPAEYAAAFGHGEILHWLWMRGQWTPPSDTTKEPEILGMAAL